MKISLIFGFLLLLPGIVLADRLEIGEGEVGKDLVIRRGDLLVVNLPANPTTGYSWSVASSSSGILKQVEASRFEPSRYRRGMVGVGGRQHWKFRAVARGKLLLNFSYARPWENHVAPVRVIQWPVTIR
jgi:inhibitor of cysteine peptidase